MITAYVQDILFAGIKATVCKADLSIGTDRSGQRNTKGINP
jgi:hypothetical protein